MEALCKCASAICQKSTVLQPSARKVQHLIVLVVLYYIYSFMTFYDGLFMLFSSLQRFFGLACHAQFFAAPLSLFPRPWCAVHEHQTLASSVLCTCQAPNHAAFAFCRSTSQWKVIWTPKELATETSINTFKQYKQYKLLFPKSKWRRSTLSPCRLPSVTSSVLPVRYPHNKEKRTRISHHVQNLPSLLSSLCDREEEHLT